MKKGFYLILFIIIAIVSCKKKDSESTPTLNIIYQDDLTTDKQTWLTDSSSTHLRKFYQGHYLLREDTIGQFVYSLAPYGTLNFAYSVQVDAIIQLDNPYKIGEIGFVFNFIDDNNFHLLEIYSNGTYRIYVRNNGNYSSIVTTTFCSTIKTGSGVKNTIKIIQNKTTMELQINNISINTFSIPISNVNTRIGLTTGTGVSLNNFTPVTGLFNNFILIKI